jgi:hypothetical protein
VGGEANKKSKDTLVVACARTKQRIVEVGKKLGVVCPHWRKGATDIIADALAISSCLDNWRFRRFGGGNGYESERGGGQEGE